MTELATTILEGSLAGPRIGHRLINRAHTRTHKHQRHIRYRGRDEETPIKPYSTEWLIDAGDRRRSRVDIADPAVDRVDLGRFRGAVMELVSSATLPRPRGRSTATIACDRSSWRTPRRRPSDASLRTARLDASSPGRCTSPRPRCMTYPRWVVALRRRTLCERSQPTAHWRSGGSTRAHRGAPHASPHVR